MNDLRQFDGKCWVIASSVKQHFPNCLQTSFVQKKSLHYWSDFFLAGGGRTRRYSRSRPVCSFHGVYVHWRRPPCRLFLPIRSAFAPLRVLRCLKYNLFKIRKLQRQCWSFSVIAGAGLEPLRPPGYEKVKIVPASITSLQNVAFFALYTSFF